LRAPLATIEKLGLKSFVEEQYGTAA